MKKTPVKKGLNKSHSCGEKIMRKNLVVFILVLALISGFCPVNTKADGSTLFKASVVTGSGEKWGYIDESGSFVIKPVYDFVKDFNDKGIAIAANGKSEYDTCTVYFIDRSGKVISGPFSAGMPEFVNDMAVINEQGKDSKVIDDTGEIILEAKYQLVSYSEGLIKYASGTSDDKKLYGYMDLNGTIVIPAAYQYAQDFKDGKAVVETSGGNYAIIDKTGKVTEPLKCFDEYQTSEGLTGYSDKDSNKYGYKFNDGTVAVKPLFDVVNQFKDGYAVVGIENANYIDLFGLIDKDGDYVIKPEYSEIQNVGNGLYAVSQNLDIPNAGSVAKKALFNNKGEQLTDFIYYQINEFDGNYAAASDDTTTFFIDQKGNIASQFPRLKGLGSMKLMGDVVEAELDGGLLYTKTDGEVIWEKDETVSLDNIKVKKIKFRRDHLTFIAYPEIDGAANKTVLEKINGQLKKLFTSGFDNSQDSSDGFYEDDYISFSAQKNKDLLIVEKSGYFYPIGAAHGQPTQDYYYIDLKTGTFYTLKDLFKSGSKYADKLTSIVNRQLQLNTKIDAITGNMMYLTDTAKVAGDQKFILGSDSIKIYYEPYEIAAYAAGFPEFEIPYGQIIDLINTKGAFWNSFDKKIVNQKINVLSDIEDKTVKSISGLMDSYEKKMIDAINGNSFSKVEGCLLKGSSLYSAQTKLVQSLNKQKIKEKLGTYEVYAVDYDYSKMEYKVFVLEETAIKYPGKAYVNKQFSWCYTAKYDDKSKSYKLSDIAKW